MLVTVLRAQNALMSECERGGTNRLQESFGNENTLVDFCSSGSVIFGEILK